MLLFYICCAIIFAICGYLTVARCYKTGILGSIGFAFAAGGAGVVVFEWLTGTEYSVAYEMRFIIGGIALYLIQIAYRARHHGVAERNRRKTDANPMAIGMQTQRSVEAQ